VASKTASPSPPASPRYRHYVLGLLFLVYVFNFVDRRILAILAEPIQKELGVPDTAMGLLMGPAFGIFYTFAGIFIARWADVGVRRSIIALGLVVWSVFTAASGLVRAAAHLALARIGVGVGEAACSPPAHSLIADYFPPGRRATALSIYSMGIYGGILVSYALGGFLREEVGWRWAFALVGLPGLLLALVLRFTVREPRRGGAEGRTDDGERPTLRDAARHMWPLRSFRHLTAGAALNSFVGYALGAWLPLFLARVHAMKDGTEIGLWLGLTFGLGGAAGTLLGGLLCDRLGARDARWHLRIPALATLLSLPFTALALLWPGRQGALLLLVPSIVFGALYLGPVFSLTQGLVKLRLRALAASVLIFAMNLVGLGLGPTAVGALSDLLDAHAGLGTGSIRYALLVVVALRLWAAVHLWLGSRSLPAELGAA